MSLSVCQTIHTIDPIASSSSTPLDVNQPIHPSTTTCFDGGITKTTRCRVGYVPHQTAWTTSQSLAGEGFHLSRLRHDVCPPPPCSRTFLRKPKVKQLFGSWTSWPSTRHLSWSWEHSFGSEQRNTYSIEHSKGNPEGSGAFIVRMEGRSRAAMLTPSPNLLDSLRRRKSRCTFQTAWARKSS